MERNAGFEPATLALGRRTPSLFRTKPAKRQLGSGWSIPAASTNASTSDRAILMALSTRKCRSSPRSQSL